MDNGILIENIKPVQCTNKPSTKKPRQSGIELLRLLVMVLIVMHHFVVHNATNLAGGGAC